MLHRTGYDVTLDDLTRFRQVESIILKHKNFNHPLSKITVAL